MNPQQHPQQHGRNIKSLASLSSSSMTTKRKTHRLSTVSEMRNIPIFELHGDKFVKPSIDPSTDEGQSGPEGTEGSDCTVSPGTSSTPAFEFSPSVQNSDDFIVPPQMSNAMLRSRLGPYQEICKKVIQEIGGINSMTDCEFDSSLIPTENNEFYEIDILVSYINALRTQVTKLGRERTKITLKVLNENWGAIKELERGTGPVRERRERMRRPQSRGVTGGRRRMDATEMGTGNPSMAYVPRSRNQTFGQTGIGSSSTSSPSIASLGMSGPSANSSIKNQKEKNFSSLSEANRKYMLRKNIPISQGPIPPSGNSDEEGAEGFVEEDF